MLGILLLLLKELLVLEVDVVLGTSLLLLLELDVVLGVLLLLLELDVMLGISLLLLLEVVVVLGVSLLLLEEILLLLEVVLSTSLLLVGEPVLEVEVSISVEELDELLLDESVLDELVEVVSLEGSWLLVLISLVVLEIVEEDEVSVVSAGTDAEVLELSDGSVVLDSVVEIDTSIELLLEVVPGSIVLVSLLLSLLLLLELELELFVWLSDEDVVDVGMSVVSVVVGSWLDVVTGALDSELLDDVSSVVVELSLLEVIPGSVVVICDVEDILIVGSMLVVGSKDRLDEVEEMSSSELLVVPVVGISVLLVLLVVSIVEDSELCVLSAAVEDDDEGDVDEVGRSSDVV
ncbi:hypothetical protein SCAR479_04335 [Seiridium cardinale]|uniref:Uncharacterized protein n=1 Tax=Seiridium cardinale TaxID=138064 RepID=A0ABR2XY45_9PEZI